MLFSLMVALAASTFPLTHAGLDSRSGPLKSGAVFAEKHHPGSLRAKSGQRTKTPGWQDHPYSHLAAALRDRSAAAPPRNAGPKPGEILTDPRRPVLPGQALELPPAVPSGPSLGHADVTDAEVNSSMGNNTPIS